MGDGLFYGEIRRDYEGFIKLLNSSDLVELGLDQCYQELHKKVYILKEILNESGPVNSIGLSYSLETLGGLIEFIYLLSQNRYKLAASSLRNSMETFAKSLIHINSLSDTNGFTNNIELAISKIGDEYIVNVQKKIRNKPLKKIIGDNYREILKKLYWCLCDIVHARDTSFNHCYEYLEEILKSNFDESKFYTLYDSAMVFTNKALVIFYIQYFETINNNMNEIKLEYIIGELEEDFHQVFRS